MSGGQRMGSELRQLVQWAKSQGFTCEQANSGHLVFRRPGTQSVHAAVSPSCKFARMKTRADLKKAIKAAEHGGGACTA
ncbi:hypothetical protein D3C84_1194920 [compost metagenome]